MSETILFGIKNCDTMKKAFKWLDTQNIKYTFHDYKKSGAKRDILVKAISEHGWERVINKAGTTWRKLPEDIKNTMNETKAIDIAFENPSIIKRPLLLHKGKTYLGFKENDYKRIFS